MNRQSCYHVPLRILAGAVVGATLAACGGSDDSSPELVSAAPTPMPATPAIVSGTAAVGAALAGANVKVIAGTPEAVCAENDIVTDGTSRFTCTLLHGSTPQ